MLPHYDYITLLQSFDRRDTYSYRAIILATMRHIDGQGDHAIIIGFKISVCIGSFYQPFTFRLCIDIIQGYCGAAACMGVQRIGIFCPLLADDGGIRPVKIIFPDKGTLPAGPPG